MNKTYTAVFSCFFPDEQVYDDVHIKVDAGDRYEAREKAWKEFENNIDSNFCGQTAEQVKLCGIFWDANRLDMQDYFDMQAELCKTEINRINNVGVLNDRIRLSENKEIRQDSKLDLCSTQGQLHLIDDIAKDLFKSHHIIPPSIHTELYYAQKIADDLFNKNEYDLADKLVQNIWDAADWKSNSMQVVKDLFREHTLFHEGSYHSMESYFGRDGCCPCSTEQRFESEQEQENMLQIGGME